MKKKLAVALAAAMVAGMTGCGSGDNAASTTDGSPEATVKESEEAAEGRSRGYGGCSCIHRGRAHHVYSRV